MPIEMPSRRQVRLMSGYAVIMYTSPMSLLVADYYATSLIRLMPHVARFARSASAYAEAQQRYALRQRAAA